VIITAIAGLSLGGIIGGIVGGSGDQTATTAGPTATATATATVTATGKASTAKNANEPEPASTMEGPGSYEIGADAMPGRYKTRVPEDADCYWEHFKEPRDESDSGTVKPGARASVTVKRGEFFYTDDCGTWTKM
jgi:hypothetical protein